ncbi:MAG: four helix bundle protein [Polyangiaceae bacterium]
MPSFHFQFLEVYVAAKELAVLVQAARISDTELRDQATRAAKSCFLNLSEGLPSRQAGIRRRHFACAIGSLAEVCAALDLANALGCLEPNFAAPTSELISKIARLMNGLMK